MTNPPARGAGAPHHSWRLLRRVNVWRRQHVWAGSSMPPISDIPPGPSVSAKPWSNRVGSP